MDKNSETFFMEESIKQMLLSPTEVKVGAIVVVNNKIVATGFKDRQNHAERVAINSAIEKGFNLDNAILFTTLEPCIETKADQKVTCRSDYIIESGIKKFTSALMTEILIYTERVGSAYATTV